LHSDSFLSLFLLTLSGLISFRRFYYPPTSFTPNAFEPELDCAASSSSLSSSSYSSFLATAHHSLSSAAGAARLSAAARASAAWHRLRHWAKMVDRLDAVAGGGGNDDAQVHESGARGDNVSASASTATTALASASLPTSVSAATGRLYAHTRAYIDLRAALRAVELTRAAAADVRAAVARVRTARWQQAQQQAQALQASRALAKALM
jgi:hypothetical protein